MELEKVSYIIPIEHREVKILILKYYIGLSTMS